MTQAFLFNLSAVWSLYSQFMDLCDWLETHEKSGEHFPEFRRHYYQIEQMDRRLQRAIVGLRGHKNTAVKLTWPEEDTMINPMYFESQKRSLEVQSTYLEALKLYENRHLRLLAAAA